MFVGSSGPPRIPYSRDAHDGVILEMDLERALPLAVLLPFEKTAERKNAALPDDEIPIQSALEDAFAPGIYR